MNVRKKCKETQSTDKKVLLIGGAGGIGHAILQQLIADDSIEHIFATYHRQLPIRIDEQETSQKFNGEAYYDTKDKVHWIQMDVADEYSIEQAITKITQQTKFISWVINAVGILHTNTNTPEKSITHLQDTFFIQNMTVNALASMLIAKHIKPLLKAGIRHEETPAIFATISARVGSISDNRVGGWYSYRMSKAALNMGMKTLSIEWQRSVKNVCVMVIQPGTVDTSLSKPYQKNVPKDGLFKPEDTAQNLLTVLSNMTANDTGCFVDWAGKAINW